MVWLLLMLEPGRDPANIYLFKINNRNTRKTGTSLEFKGVYVSKMFTSKLGKLANFRSWNDHKWSFQGNIVSMGYISVVIDFDVLWTFWVFTVNVPLMEKTGCWFALRNSIVLFIKMKIKISLSRRCFFVTYQGNIYVPLMDNEPARSVSIPIYHSPYHFILRKTMKFKWVFRFKLMFLDPTDPNKRIHPTKFGL